MGQILIIEDDPVYCGMLCQFLERAGHTVHTAGNGSEGLAVFRQMEAELVITDILMPEKEGLETIATLRREQPGLPIIAISGGGRLFGVDNPLRAAEKLGANHSLTKPFSRKQLLELVKTLLK